MYLSTLNDWLTYIESIHATEIEFGLERVSEVGARLGVLTPAPCVITVSGTNGKGSTIATLEAIYRASGYRVGVFNSPILFKHNEYVRVNGVEASDAVFCEAYQKIEEARGEVSLTPFEFHTLAALLIFKSNELDVILLEVGLGGRWDAVNIIDAEVAIITSISFDHIAYLGNTLEAIAFEKAGIVRKGKPAVCGEQNPPVTLINHANTIGAFLFCLGKQFSYQKEDDDWSWSDDTTSYNHLSIPGLLLQNCSTALKAVTLLQSKLPVSEENIRMALNGLTLPGRIQVKLGEVTEIYDVAHNPAAVKVLSDKLTRQKTEGKIHAVFSMLADKDINESLKVIRDKIDHWYIAPTQAKRTATLSMLKEKMEKAKIHHVSWFESISAAYDEAKKNAKRGDCIVCFGSFYTVKEVMVLKENYSQENVP